MNSIDTTFETNSKIYDHFTKPDKSERLEKCEDFALNILKKEGTHLAAYLALMRDIKLGKTLPDSEHRIHHFTQDVARIAKAVSIASRILDGEKDAIDEYDPKPLDGIAFTQFSYLDFQNISIPPQLFSELSEPADDGSLESQLDKLNLVTQQIFRVMIAGREFAKACKNLFPENLPAPFETVDKQFVTTLPNAVSKCVEEMTPSLLGSLITIYK